jgi:glycosyltransferase involved in cell wall biosynthesis
MQDEPLTVVLPVKNGASVVGDALLDLVSTLGPNDELLIVDDGSEDSTPQILAEWAARDPRIRVVTTAGMGLVYALNLGIWEATHGWIARADADDRYPPNRLELQRDALGPHVALVSGDYRLIPSEGAPTFLPCALGRPFVALSLINPQRIPHPGVVISRDAVIATGGYQKEDYPAEDLGLWLRLSAEGDFVGVPDVVVDWTMSSGSVSHSRQAEQRSATRKLLAAWRPALLDQVDDEAVSRELARYATSSHAGERVLLLLRDIRAWHQRGEHLPGEAEILKSSARHPVSTLRAGWRLAHEARLRRRARSGLVASLEES